MLLYSAILVAGGSFGVITGKILAILNIPYIFIIFLCISLITCVLYIEIFFKENINYNAKSLVNFNYQSKKYLNG